MKPHPRRMSTCLREQTPEILRRWETRARAEIPASRAQASLVLQNNLRYIIGEVARELSPTGESPTLIEGLTLSGDHGVHRAEIAEYHVGELFLEFRLLRRTILEVLDEQARLTADQREVINEAVERAVQEAVSQFAAVQPAAERDSQCNPTGPTPRGAASVAGRNGSRKKQTNTQHHPRTDRLLRVPDGVRRLPPHLQRVVIWRFYDAFSCREIGALLGSDEQLACALLREALAEVGQALA